LLSLHDLNVLIIDGANAFLVIIAAGLAVKQNPAGPEEKFVFVHNRNGIAISRKYLAANDFVIRDMGCLCYFFSIEFAYGKGSITLSQRKYIFDLLTETSMLECQFDSTPIE